MFYCHRQQKLQSKSICFMYCMNFSVILIINIIIIIIFETIHVIQLYIHLLRVQMKV